MFNTAAQIWNPQLHKRAGLRLFWRSHRKGIADAINPDSGFGCVQDSLCHSATTQFGVVAWAWLVK